MSTSDTVTTESANVGAATSTQMSSPSAMNPSSSSSSATGAKTSSSIHSSLRVVTNPGELGVCFPSALTPASSGKWTPLRSPSSLLLSPLGMLASKSFKHELSGANADGMLEASKELQFDPRFLAEAWSQESPQSVYALLGQSSLGATFAGFSPLAASSPGGSRLLSPMGIHHSSSASSLPQMQMQSHPQSFLSHLQSPLLAMSPVGSSGGGFYPPSVSIPTSPPHLNPHLLSPMFATAISPGGGLGVSPDMLSMVDPSTVFVPPSSPSAILRHLLPPIMPRNTTLNVKDLTLNELRPHFNKPMAVVAKELGVCITLMKKICRRNGLVRWPHRRIRSLVNRITSLQVIAASAVGAEKKRFQAQIAALRDELSAVIQNPNEKSRKAQADAKSRSPPPSVPAPGSRKRRASGSQNASTSDEANEDDEDDEEDENDERYGDENASTQAKTQQAYAPVKREPLATAKATLKTTASKAAASRPPAPATTKSAGTAGASASIATNKRATRFRSAAAAPPPIKIPRRSEYEAARRELDAELGEQPSSTTSTGSCGKRGSISSILC